MANASGSLHYFAIQQETTAGVLPSPFTPTELRILEGGSFSDNRSPLVSGELRSDRQIISSTLGTPNPEWGASVEWSFNSFNALIEGALQNSFSGDTYASGITVDVAAGATITTDGGELWSSYGATDSEVITITGLTASAENGSYIIASGSGTNTLTLTDLSGSPASFTLEADATLTVIGGRSSIVIDSSANNITVAATARTITAASTIWKSASPDLRYGDLIYLNGFTNAGNNGYFKVTGVTATVLTLSTDATTLVDETLSTGDLEVANNTSIITTGTTKKNYAIESGYNDVALYRQLLGAQVGSMSLSMSTDSLVSGDFSLMGRELTAFAVTSAATSVTSASTTPVFNTFRGDLEISGGVTLCLTDLSISLDNNSQGQSCLFTRALSDIVHGRSNVTGSLSAYFDDPTLSNLYSDETLISIFVTMVDADGNSISIGLPRCQLQGDSFNLSEVDVTESLDFQALGGDTTYTNIYLINSRAIPV